MTIVVTGGGSGGHITPILAVASQLKKRSPRTKIVYIGQKGDALVEVVRESPVIDEVFLVRAGKFRRYHGEGWRQLVDLKSMIKNIRDSGYVGLGVWQCRRLLSQLQPEAIFIKGGFIGVPVGLAAARLGIPYVTHDSDAIPGLANRLIARWASWHAVAMPEEVYDYPRSKTVRVGVPIDEHFRTVSPKQQVDYRQELGLIDYKYVVLVTGGGLGAQRLNQAVLAIAPGLLKSFPGLALVQAAGAKHQQQLQAAYKKVLQPAEQGRVVVKGFISQLYKYSGAADLIVTRAGATHLAEFAAQQKACIVVPNPLLTGGHQLKNAAELQAKGASVTIDEATMVKRPDLLRAAVEELLNSPDKRRAFGEALAQFAVPDAADKLAQLVLKVADERSKQAR